jgi:hypothetical protein
MSRTAVADVSVANRRCSCRRDDRVVVQDDDLSQKSSSISQRSNVIILSSHSQPSREDFMLTEYLSAGSKVSRTLL